MNGKHTPSPWNWNGTCLVSEPTDESDVALIAAAPALLAALRLMVAAHEHEAGFYLHPDGRPKLTATREPSPKGSALAAARAAISQVQQGQQTEEQA